MFRKTAAAILLLLIAVSTSHAQNIPSRSDITEYEFRQIIVSYIACLENNYTENSKHISEKREIARRTIASCKPRKDALKDSFLIITNSPRKLNALLEKAERYIISRSSKKYDADSGSHLIFLGKLEEIYKSCAMANRPHVLDLYDEIYWLLRENFAYYRNPRAMEKAQIKYAKLIDLPLAKSAPEQWCHRVADEIHAADPDLKKQLFVE